MPNGAFMIYELRDYTLKPGYVPNYLDLFESSGLPRLSAFAELIGYWRVESGGGLNRVLHLWRYESRASRMLNREELYRDKAWLEDFLPHGIAMLQSQRSFLLSKFDFSPDPATLRTEASLGGQRLFELETYELPPAKVSSFAGLLQRDLQIRKQFNVAAFALLNETGQVGTVRMTAAYSDEVDRDVLLGQLTNDEEYRHLRLEMLGAVLTARREVLYPAKFSPLR